MQFLCFSLVAGLLIARLIDFCFSRCLQGENRLDDTKSSQHITQVSTTRVHERARKNLGRQLRPRMDGGDERPTRSLSLIVMTRSSDVKLVVLDSPFTRRRAADGFFYPDTRFFSIVQRCQWRHKVFGLIFLPESKGGRCRYKQNEQKRKKGYGRKRRKYMYTHETKERADSSADVAARSLLFEWTAN